MKLFSKTLADYLIQTIIQPMLKGGSDTHETRVLLASFTPEIIYETGRRLTDYIASGEWDIEFVYKIGAGLWQEWQQDGNSAQLMSEFEKSSWVDNDNRLTYYRNLKWEAVSGKDGLIVMLIGIDQATDQGSLADFYYIDASALWKIALKNSFNSWISETLNKNGIESEKEHSEQINELLKLLYKQSGGDLMRIAEFLGNTDFKGAQDGIDALDMLYEALSFWDLPLLSDMKTKGKRTKYVEKAINFFSYQPYLTEGARKKALTKIEDYTEQINEGEPPPYIPDIFDDFDDLTDTLKTYIEKNTPETREKLLKFDYAIINDKILGFKPKSEVEKKPKPPAIRKLSGYPLEIILTAVWQTLTDYKQEADKNKIQPGKALKAIRLEPIIFYHDFDENEDGFELINGILGGVDAFLENQIQIEYELDDDRREIQIASSLLNEDKLKKAGTKIPNFQFRVTIDAEDEAGISRTYQWQIPETHAYRTLWNIAKQVQERIKSTCLPVFFISYYHEIFSAPDEDECNRILQHGLRNFKIGNLLEAPGLNKNTAFWGQIGDLSKAFGDFINSLVHDGYFNAIEAPRESFCRKMIAILTALAFEKNDDTIKEYAALIYKSFLITDGLDEQGKNWYWEPSLNSAVVTGLHPALLEMLRHRETFLIHGFLQLTHELLTDAAGKKFGNHKWHNVCDLAGLNYPLFGLITDRGQTLDTRVASMGLLHRIGRPLDTETTLSAKILQRYDAPEEEEIDDSELFRQTREARKIKNILKEFVKLHPHANDGLSLAILNTGEIQPIIAGIDIFLKEKLGNEHGEEIDSMPPYHFSMTVFVRPFQSRDTAHWLWQWRKRWEPSQLTDKLKYYQQCRISLSHRVIRDKKDYESVFIKERFEPDIALLARFVESKEGGDKVEKAEPYKTDWESLLKFPILESPQCMEEHPSRRYYRKRVISNRRFKIATLHSELSAQFKHPSLPEDEQHIVINESNFAPWIHVVDLLHKYASWVVCIDPIIDERLIGQDDNENWKREIIGFSSGIGTHGELNYTVSTERASITDIQKRIQKQINRIFGPWELVKLEKAAKTLIDQSKRLSGLSLVRATGPSEYVRDLIAYALIRICLPSMDSDCLCLCDEIIGLDAFQHWFDDSEEQHRPDLMRIVAFLDASGIIRVTAHLIECKVAKQNSIHLEKARIQIENGLRQLVPLFMPKQSKNRFDERFWWAQLQRLIATKAVIPVKKQDEATAALEKLGNGIFEIQWHAAAVTFWTDSDKNRFTRETQWTYYDVENQKEIDIAVFTCGTGLVERVCCREEIIPLPFVTENGWFHAANAIASAQSAEIAQELTYAKETIREIDDISDETEPHPSPYNIETSGHSQPETIEPAIAEPSSHLQIPKRIFLGPTENAKRDLYWEFGHTGLPNRHFLIFGKSGAGKTYAIQSILFELARKEQNTVIIDYTNGFLPNQLESIFHDTVKPVTHVVRQSPLPINPFQIQQQIIAEGLDPIPEDPHTVGGRITSVFTSVYSSFGEQQKATLIKIIREGVTRLGSKFSFENLLEDLENLGNAGVGLANKISPLVHSRLFGGEDENSWQALYHHPENNVNIMQLAGVPREIAQMTTEFVLWDLYNYATNNGNQNIPLPIVLDEIQNLDHRLDAPLAKMLTEGRKFGLSLILATQTLSNLKAEERDRLFQAGHKLFFKPADTEVQEYGKILERATNEKAHVWARRLTSLNKGECYSLGPSPNLQTGKLEDKAFRIKIASFEERNKRRIT